MRRALALVALLLAALVASSSTLHAQENKRRPLTVEDLWKVKRPGKPAVSPDGEWVAVEVTSYSIPENSSDSDLWLLSVDGKTQKQLTFAKGKESSPSWSPDGKHIAFIAKRTGDVAQVFVISPNGGEARPVSKLPMSPMGFKWSPDGKSIYCLVQTWTDTLDDESYLKKERERRESKVQAYVIDDAMYRYWDAWLADGKRPVVFKVDVETGMHQNLFAKAGRTLAPVAPSAESFDISPDGKEICFVSETTPVLGMDFNADLFVMPVDGSSPPVNITLDNPAGDTSPRYSPDGKSIAFLRQTVKFFYADRQRIMLFDRESKKSTELTAKLDRSCSSLNWTPGNEGIAFEVEDKGTHRIYGYAMKPGVVFPFTDGFSDTNPSMARNIKTTAFLRSSFNSPGQVWIIRPKGQEVDLRRIDRFNDELTATWALGEVSERYIKGAGGADVQLWVVKPPNMEPGKKFPLLQMIHGGPHNAIPTDFHYRWNLQLLAAQGYVVGCVNFHGSSSFGQAFTDSITGDMATKPFEDVMKATDVLANEPYVDSNRLAAAGASYGGYMIAWINGHTDRFKALVCHAGVYNWHSMMASDVVRSRERPLGTLPWGDQTKIDRQNPQRFAAHFKTPTLVLHGEKDYRVPVTQGFEFYNTLRIKGVPSRLVYFPDENHWILKPQNSVLWHREVFAWLEKHVGAGPR